ncbi:hypothetical protein GF351_05810 [Candidatus Woesearchaeota archaeon]|nr:hypothetical protein [Candidatus Woesearchaeota archaeon]
MPEKIKKGWELTKTAASKISNKGAQLNLFIFVALLYHIIDVVAFSLSPSYSARFVIHFIIGFLAWVIFTPEEADGAERLKTLPKYLAISFLAIYFVHIGNWTASITSTAGIKILTVAIASVTNAMLAPVWLYYALFQGQVRKTRLANFLTWIIVLFWIMVVLTTALTEQSIAWGSDERISMEQRSIAMNLWQGTKGFFTTSYARMLGTYNQTVQYARGDYYTGQVDSKAQEKLGVYLEEVESADPEVRTDEPITIYGKLEAKTLDEPINVTVTCSSEGVPPASIYPDKDLMVDYETTEYLNCYFERGTFSEGDRKFTFNVDFNFVTTAYMQTYLMDRINLRYLKDIDTDPFTNYDMQRPSSTQAKNSAGPVSIGMGPNEPPMGIYEDRDTRFTLDIDLANTWDGEVKQITDLILIFPKGIFVETDSSSKETMCGGYSWEEADCFEVDPEERWCEDAEVTIYKYVHSPEDATIDGFSTVRKIICKMRVDDTYYNELVGGSPEPQVHYFRVIAGYDYRLSQSVNVDIEKGEELSEDIDTYTCRNIDSRPEEGWPGDEMQERYTRYQRLVQDAVAENDPKDLEKEEAEAAVAAVLSSVTRMGDSDYSTDSDTTPDYIAGCWSRHGRYVDEPREDIRCAAAMLKIELDRNEGDVMDAIERYSEDTGTDINLENAEHYYYQWLNRLCEITDAGEEEGEQVEDEDEDSQALPSLSVNVTGKTIITKGDMISINAELSGDIPDEQLAYRWSYTFGQDTVTAETDTKNKEENSEDTWFFKENVVYSEAGLYSITVEVLEGGSDGNLLVKKENFATISVEEPGGQDEQ